jgi:hypothetical protein
MKRLLLAFTILGIAAVIAGCPIYSDTGNYRVCTSSSCYDCPDPSLSSACILWQCGSNSDCGDGFECSGNECTPIGGPNVVFEAGIGSGGGSSSTAVEACYLPSECSPGFTCGFDGVCHPGSCQSWGCVVGYTCNTASLTCTASNVSVLDASIGETQDAAHLTDVSSEAASPEGGDASPPGPTACNADGQCGGGGSRCINGVCTAQSALCSDGTQCASGESCVNGICTPHCAASNPCPIGFECDLTRGVCNLNPTPCASTTDCQGGAVCVEGYCVAPCAAADAGPACPNEELCVNGGCIPNQAAAFACKNNGYTGAVANTCDPASICLHDDCYVECDLDGGGCADPSTVCKEVTTAQGTFDVCAPPSELGSQCDPAAGVDCGPDSVCIDGYCK